MKRLLLVLVLVACDSSVAPGLELTPLDPPTVYAEWYADAESCAGAEGDIERVQFYTTPATLPYGAFECPHPKGCCGQWSRSRSIVLSEDYVADRVCVTHEMLHDLVGGGHPQAFYDCNLMVGW